MQKERTRRPLTRVFLRIRPVFRWIVRLRSSPGAIAGGFSLGLFIAFTPTVGLQVILAVILATILNVNRPAAIMAVWVTNPVTIPAIFTFNYWLGSHLWAGPSVSLVSQHLAKLAARLTTLDIWEITDQLKAVAELGQEIIIPLLLGSIIVGVIVAAVSFIILLKLLRLFFARRDRKKAMKLAKGDKG